MFAKIDKHQVAVSKSKLRLPINVCWIIKRHVNYCHVYNKMTRQCQSSSYLQIHRNVDICPVFQNDVASHSESLSGVAGQYRLKDAQACKWSSNATTNDLRKWSPDCTTSRDRNGYKGKVWTHDWIWQWIWSLENRFFFSITVRLSKPWTLLFGSQWKVNCHNNCRAKDTGENVKTAAVCSLVFSRLIGFNLLHKNIRKHLWFSRFSQFHRITIFWMQISQLLF